MTSAAWEVQVFLFSTWALRLLGLSGVLGAVLFIAGDLSYNHVPGSTESVATRMSNLSERRLLRAGTLGVFGCWLYLLGALHAYLAFRPLGEIFAFFLGISFAAVMACYGLSHTAYFAIAAGAQAARQCGADVEAGARLGAAFFARLVAISYVPVLIVSALMAYGVGSGRSLYPRWMIVLLPVVVYVLRVPLLKLLPGRARELANDSYDNLVLLVYYAASTLVLWNASVV